MKPIHILACLFSILVALLDLIAVAGFNSDYATPLMLFVGLVCGQLALLAFWCVLGRGLLLARLVTTVAVAACLSQPLGKFTGVNWAQWFTLLCLFTAGTAGTVLLAVLFGARPLIVDAAPDAPFPASGRQPLTQRFSQFSLSSLLSAMTVFGIGLGLSRYFAFPQEQSLAVAVYGFWLVLIASATLAAVVSRRALSIRLAGLAALCLAAGWFMARTESQPDAWFFTNVAFIEAIVICMGLAVIQSGMGMVREEDLSLPTAWPSAAALEVLAFDIDTGNRQHNDHED